MFSSLPFGGPGRLAGLLGAWCLVQVKRKEETYNKGKYALDQQVAGSKSRAEDEERRLESQNGTAESLDRVAAENKAATDVLRVQIEVSAAKEGEGETGREPGRGGQTREAGGGGRKGYFCL